MLSGADGGGQLGGRGEDGEVLFFFVAMAALGKMMLAAMGGKRRKVVCQGFA